MVLTVKVVDFIGSTEGETEHQNGLCKTICKAIDIRSGRASLAAQSVKHLPAMQEDPSPIPESGRSPEEGNGNPLQYSCLGNPMDRGAQRATAHSVTRVRQVLATKPTYLPNYKEYK